MYWTGRYPCHNGIARGTHPADRRPNKTYLRLSAAQRMAERLAAGCSIVTPTVVAKISEPGMGHTIPATQVVLVPKQCWRRDQSSIAPNLVLARNEYASRKSSARGVTAPSLRADTPFVPTLLRCRLCLSAIPSANTTESQH